MTTSTRNESMRIYKVGKNIASKTSLIASCTIFSLGFIIPKGLVPPLGLGISYRRAGLNLNAPEPKLGL